MTLHDLIKKKVRKKVVVCFMFSKTIFYFYFLFFLKNKILKICLVLIFYVLKNTENIKTPG